MKKIGLMLAMQKELEFFIPFLQNATQQTKHQRTFYLGETNNLMVIAAVSGMGKVNAALCAADLINEFKVDIIINIGISGGLDASLQIGDFVAGKEIVYHDVWCGEPNQYGQVQDMPEKYGSSPQLLALVSNLRQGMLCCGDFFVSTTEKLNEIKSHFPEGLAIDMESAAIAQTCYMYKIPFLSVRQISDTPGAENHAEQYATFWQNAPRNSVLFLQNLLSKID